jgi:hypothetical protein
MTEYYYIFKDELGTEFLFDGIDDDSDADALLEDDYMQLTSYQKIELSKTDYVTGYFFFNDECDGENDNELDSYSFNNTDDLYLFSECCDSGGHYERKRYDIYINGTLSNTIAE